MSQTKIKKELIDASLGADWQATLKTADFTAIAGEGYFVNTTSAAITVTLPSSPSFGDEINLVDYAGTADTNNIIITSSDNINGSSGDYKINYERGGVSMVYVDATQGWIAYNANNETASALVPDVPLIVDYLVVAGGGGGGASISGGGGAGGLRTSYGSTQGGGQSSESNLTLTGGTNYTVTVGAGGVGGTDSGIGGVANGSNGGNSVFSTITSIGGGTSEDYGGAGTSGIDGGSGGGGPRRAGSTYGNAVTSPVVHGYRGGSGSTSGGTDNYGSGGGGGGAGSVGGNASGSTGGAGGSGLAVSITGSPVTYAGGGGGGCYNGTGGSGTDGGGNGSSGTVAATNGSPNVGAGGGAGGYPTTTSGGDGGSGVVIIRYPDAYTVTIGAGLTGSTTTDGSDKVTTFTAGTGNISFS
jgi:hypothetical protein